MTNSPKPASNPDDAGPEHPLDPLTAGEIQQAAAMLRLDRGVGETWRFASIELKEPAKGALAVPQAGQQTGRPAARRSWSAGTAPTARPTGRWCR